MIMLEPTTKYGAAKLKRERHRRRVIAMPGGFLAGIVLMVSAVPAPLFADSGPGANIAIALSSSIVASPVGTGEAARAVPGAVVDFSVAVTGPIATGSPATSFAITNRIPDQMSLFVGDLAEAGTGPAVFMDNDSGLMFRFDGLASATDSIEFSSNGGKTYDYVPVADADGFDQNITHIILRPHGALRPAIHEYERFSIGYRMKVK